MTNQPNERTPSGPPATSGPAKRKLSRPQQRWIAGVCAGLAQRFGMQPNTVRLLFVLSLLLPGTQFIVYLVLWLLMPSE